MNRAVVILAVLALLVLSVVPISRTLFESVLDRTVVDGGQNGGLATLTLRHYDEAFVSGSPQPATETTQLHTPATRPVSARWRLLGNSVLIAALAAAFALLFGVPYALLVGRTDAPMRTFLGSFYAAPLVLPPLLVAIAWTFLPGFGPPPQTEAPTPSAFGAAASALRSAFLFGLCYFPLVVLFARRAFSRIPASLEEAARLAGGPGLALRRVTLPLASPGILAGGLFVFLFALNDFSLVDYLNWDRPTADQISVYPFESFTAWSKTQGESVATALGMPLALLGVGLLWVIQRLVGRDARATVSGDFREPSPWRLGAWRWPASIAATVLVLVAAGTPVVGLAIKAGGIDNYRAVWRLVAGANSSTNELWWSLALAVATAVLALPLAFILGHHAARTRRLTWMALAILPLALPPIFLGAGYLRLLNLPMFTLGGRNPFLDADGPRLGSAFLLVAKYVPFGIVALWAAFLEIDPRLEEAAATAGVRPLDRALGILVPLARPALAVAYLLVFVLALREIDTIVLLNSDTVMRRIYTMVHFSRDAQVAALCIVLVAVEALPFAVYALLTPRRTAQG